MNKLIEFPVFDDLLQNLEYLDMAGGTEVWEGDGPPPTSARPSVAGGFGSEGVYVCGDLLILPRGFSSVFCGCVSK